MNNRYNFYKKVQEHAPMFTNPEVLVIANWREKPYLSQDKTPNEETLTNSKKQKSSLKNYLRDTIDNF